MPTQQITITINLNTLDAEPAKPEANALGIVDAFANDYFARAIPQGLVESLVPLITPGVVAILREQKPQ